MNMCSIQLYVTFRRTQILAPIYYWKQTWLNVLYIISGSLIFVSANIIVSLVKSQGQDVGYGQDLCYLSSKLMQIITFLVPSAVLLISNILMFIVVVLKIRRLNADVAIYSEARNYFPVYARLSTLTGFTWTLGFILIFVKNDALEYLFIILNASQGVFIMASFVLNKRVCSSKRLEKDLHTKGQTDSTTTK